jgi:hypothetical protein
VDLTDTIQPKSDQANADDFLSGPRTFTVAEVRRSESAEQPVEVVLKEFPPGRPWKPNKSMRRVLVQAWGVDAANYVGRRLTLFTDKSVKWGGAEVGGIRIRAMSHINKPLSMNLTVTRGKRAPYKVDPLPDDAPSHPIVTSDTLAELDLMFERKGIPADAQLAGVNRVIGGSATDLETITEHEARQVIEALSHRPDVVADDGPNSTAELPIAAEPEGWAKR